MFDVIRCNIYAVYSVPSVIDAASVAVGNGAERGDSRHRCRSRRRETSRRNTAPALSDTPRSFTPCASPSAGASISSLNKSINYCPFVRYLLYSLPAVRRCAAQLTRFLAVENVSIALRWPSITDRLGTFNQSALRTSLFK